MKGSPILEVPTIHSGSMLGGLDREIKGVRFLLAFVSLFCPASSCVFLDRVLGSGSHQPQLRKALPFWEMLLPCHLLAYSSSPCYSPSLHQDLESPLQEPSGESSPALTDCQKWSDVHFFGLATIYLPGSCYSQYPNATSAAFLNPCMYVNFSRTFDQRKTFLSLGR